MAGPYGRGSVTARSTGSPPSMLTHRRPSSTASANAPVHSRTPASLSNSETEAAACSPNMLSGLCS